MDSTTRFRFPPDAYERYMGLWSRPLAVAFAEAAGVHSGQRALDVGCGTGALTAELVRRLGAAAVAGVDPAVPAATACASALPGADIRHGDAESLSFADDEFDITLSQLAVNFMHDAPAALAEMARVTRSGGTIAACTWDYRDGMTMLRIFWDAAESLDPAADHEGSVMRYCTPAELSELWQTTLAGVETDALVVERTYAGFDDFWEPFTLGVGPAGAYVDGLDEPHRADLRRECFRSLDEPGGAFTLSARAWFVRGTV